MHSFNLLFIPFTRPLVLYMTTLSVMGIMGRLTRLFVVYRTIDASFSVFRNLLTSTSAVWIFIPFYPHWMSALLAWKCSVLVHCSLLNLRIELVLTLESRWGNLMRFPMLLIFMSSAPVLNSCLDSDFPLNSPVETTRELLLVQRTLILGGNVGVQCSVLFLPKWIPLTCEGTCDIKAI